MRANFSYNNIVFKKDSHGEGLVARGEITNKTGRDFHSVVFRLVLFIKNIPIGDVAVTINGFNSGQTRTFEKQVGELVYSKVIKDISRYEIFPDSGY